MLNWPSMNASELRALLQAHVPRRLDDTIENAAAVGLVFRGWDSGLELGFIRRPVSPSDPWSGQIAFPGGRRDAGDADLLAAAVREIDEEVGWRLEPHELLGAISDIQARRSGELLPFFIRPFVFDGGDLPAPSPDPSEVDEWLWVPFSHLLDPENHVDFPWQRGGLRAELPGIRLNDKDVLWGLSYMILTDFVLTLAKSAPDLVPADVAGFWRHYGP